MKEYLTRLLNQEKLSSQDTKDILMNITKESYPQAQIAALLSMLQLRGVTADELIGFRQALMETRVPVDLSPFKPLDIVGSGGDGKNTFNISTCACFVVAGAGYKVAKHGNFGATSVSGASTVIQQHGVKFTVDRDTLMRSIEEAGICYLHAQLFAKAMKFVGPTRKALGFPTVFNLLGPLINPCEPTYQLLGTANLEQMRLYANVMNKLGIRYSIVTSLDGYDEISLTGDFKICTSDYEHVFSPEDLGLAKSFPDQLFGGASAEDAARIFDSVLAGTSTNSQRQTVLANAAAAIQLIEREKGMAECLDIARESLDSGRALTAFNKFVEINS